LEIQEREENLENRGLWLMSDRNNNTETIKVSDLQRSTKRSSKRSIDSGKFVDKTVTFIDHKGRMWNSEMSLPENTTMETMLSIAQTNIGMMNNKETHRTDLVVLIEPKELSEMILREVDRVVIFDRTKLDILEGRR
jgi:hypothetical protein